MRQQQQQDFNPAQEIRQTGTVPGQFPPDPLMQPGQIAVANKQGISLAFGSTVFFTAPATGWYSISASVRVNASDAAGTFTLTVTIPGAPNLPGVQCNPATPANGEFPSAPYFLTAGQSVSASGAVGVAFTTGNVDVWLFALRLN